MKHTDQKMIATKYIIRHISPEEGTCPATWKAEGAGVKTWSPLPWFLWEGAGQASKRVEAWLVGMISVGSGVGAVPRGLPPGPAVTRAGGQWFCESQVGELRAWVGSGVASLHVEGTLLMLLSTNWVAACWHPERNRLSKVSKASRCQSIRNVKNKKAWLIQNLNYNWVQFRQGAILLPKLPTLYYFNIPYPLT